MVANIKILDTTPVGARVQVDPSAIMASVQRSIQWAGGQAPRSGGQRYDSGGGLVMPSRHGLDAYSRHVDQLALRELAQRSGGRLPRMDGLSQSWANHVAALPKERRDALSGGAGGFPRDFEFVRTQAWEEERQPLNAARLFPRDTSVPLGARSHTARRIVGDGEAEIYRGGSVQVRARTSFKEETFGVLYIVSAVQTQFFEQLTTDYAGIRQYQNDMRMAERLVDERWNEIAWNGDEPSDVYGILNYPHLATQIFPLTASDSVDARAFVRALNTVQYTPLILTGGTFSPTRLATSPRVRAWMYSKQHSDATDTTMARYFLDNQDPSGGVQSIEAAQELQGIGPNGEDGMLFYRPEVDSMGLVDIQATTTLPVFQSSALEQTTIVYSAFGGTIMGNVGNHLLALVPTDGIG